MKNVRILETKVFAASCEAFKARERDSRRLQMQKLVDDPNNPAVAQAKAEGLPLSLVLA